MNNGFSTQKDLSLGAILSSAPRSFVKDCNYDMFEHHETALQKVNSCFHRSLFPFLVIILEIDDNCVVPENIHTPPTEGIGNSGEEGGSQRPKNLKQCMELNWNSQRGGGGGGS